jgi:hypothetical protein
MWFLKSFVWTTRPFSNVCQFHNTIRIIWWSVMYFFYDKSNIAFILFSEVF